MTLLVVLLQIDVGCLYRLVLVACTAGWCWLLVQQIGVGWLKILVLVACTTDWCWCGDVARADPPPQDLVNACA